MIEFFEAFIDGLLKFFDVNPSIMKFLVLPLTILPLSIMVRMLNLFSDHSSFGLFDVVAALFRWIFSKLVELLCSFEFGFRLAYKFGWAKPGVHFFDCGIHCSTCPRFLSCTSELKDEGGCLDD